MMCCGLFQGACKLCRERGKVVEESKHQTHHAPLHRRSRFNGAGVAALGAEGHGSPAVRGSPAPRWTSRTAHVRAPREGRDTASTVEAQSREPASRTRPDDRHDSRSSSARLAVVIRTARRVYDRGSSRTSFTGSKRNIPQPELRKKKTIVRLETSLTILKKTVNSRRCGDPRREILPPRCGYAVPFAACPPHLAAGLSDAQHACRIEHDRGGVPLI
jgi:hypothetical protein